MLSLTTVINQGIGYLFGRQPVQNPHQPASAEPRLEEVEDSVLVGPKLEEKKVEAQERMKNVIILSHGVFDKFAEKCTPYKESLVKKYGPEGANIPVAKFSESEMEFIKKASEIGDRSFDEKVKTLYLSKIAAMKTSLAIVPNYKVHLHEGNDFHPKLFGRVHDRTGNENPMEAVLSNGTVYYKDYIRYFMDNTMDYTEAYLIDLYKGKPKGYLAAVYSGMSYGAPLQFTSQLPVMTGNTPSISLD